MFFSTFRVILGVAALFSYLFMDCSNPVYHRLKYVVPLVFLKLYIFNYLAQKYERFLRMVIPLTMVTIGITISHQNLALRTYRLHEMWPLYYFLCLFVLIVHWFDWEKILIAFLTTKWYFIFRMINRFDDIPFQFLFFVPTACLLYLIMWMVISFKIQNLITMIEKNKELISTVRNILKFFPEGVIIKSWNENLQQMVINLANETAQKDLLRYPDPENKPLQESMLDYKGKLTYI